MPLHALLFVMLVPGLASLYGWWPDASEAGGHLVAGKGWWLSKDFFLARAAGYFALWIALSWRWRDAWRTPQAPAPRGGRHAVRWDSSSIRFTAWLAGVDWVMSLEPAWVSSGFGLLFGTVQMLGALAFGIAIAPGSRPFPPPKHATTLATCC